MPAMVAGVYKQGRLELLEIPEGFPEGRVRVVLIEESAAKPPHQPLTFGKYSAGPMSTWEDFQAADFFSPGGARDS